MSKTTAKIARMSPAERWDEAMTAARAAYIQLQIMRGEAEGAFLEALQGYQASTDALVEVLGTMLAEGQLDDVHDIIDVAYSGRS